MQNCIRAICERVFYVKDANGSFIKPPAPIPQAFDRLSTIRSQIITHVIDHNSHLLTRKTYDDVILASHPTKKTILTNSKLSLLHKPIRKVDSYVSMFIKFEKIDNVTKADPVPRVVSPRTPRYALELATFIKHLEKPIFAALDSLFGEVTVMKGLNAVETATHIQRKWQKFNNPVSIDLDAERFDQHQSVDCLNYEHSLYLGMMKPFLSNDDYILFRNLLSWQLESKHYCRTTDGYTIKYKTKGVRCSGDMNTSLGNCAIMCSLIKYFFVTMKLDASLCNNGDDCVIICNKENAHLVTNHIRTFMLTFGFSMKVGAPVSELEQTDFCQCRPVFNGDQYVMVRNIINSLCKDSIMLSPTTSKLSINQWRHTVAVGGLALTDGIPIMVEFYKMMNRDAESLKVNWNLASLKDTGFAQMCKNLKYGNKPITPEARRSLFLAYGFTVEQQLYYESEFKKYTWNQFPTPGKGNHNPNQVVLPPKLNWTTIQKTTLLTKTNHK